MIPNMSEVGNKSKNILMYRKCLIETTLLAKYKDFTIISINVVRIKSNGLLESLGSFLIAGEAIECKSFTSIGVRLVGINLDRLLESFQGFHMAKEHPEYEAFI